MKIFRYDHHFDYAQYSLLYLLLFTFHYLCYKFNYSINLDFLLFNGFNSNVNFFLLFDVFKYFFKLRIYQTLRHLRIYYISYTNHEMNDNLVYFCLLYRFKFFYQNFKMFFCSKFIDFIFFNN